MLETNKIVHGLWIGTELSPIELLTINSFIEQGHSFNLWVYDKISTSLPPQTIIKDANTIIDKKDIFCYKNSNQFGHGKGSFAGFSDIFRYKLLYTHGGWWTDMDVTCLKPLDFKEDYVFRTHQKLELVGNLMKCPKNSELMKLCFEEAKIKINENNTDWHLPIQILIDNVYNLNLSKYIINFTNMDSWNVVRKLLKNKSKLDDSWYAIHWINEELRRNKINKNVFLNKSILYELVKKNNIKTQNPNLLQYISYYYKISTLGHGIKILKSKLL